MTTTVEVLRSLGLLQKVEVEREADDAFTVKKPDRRNGDDRRRHGEMRIGSKRRKTRRAGDRSVAPDTLVEVYTSPVYVQLHNVQGVYTEYVAGTQRIGSTPDGRAVLVDYHDGRIIGIEIA